MSREKLDNYGLTSKEYAVYRLLESQPDKWFSKGEIVDALPDYFDTGDSTSHDFCSTLNLCRIRLNRAVGIDGRISHHIALKNNHFKLADADDVKEEIRKRKDALWRDYLRLLRLEDVVKYNGQGKLIDCNGKAIDEESLAKRFFAPFDFE